MKKSFLEENYSKCFKFLKESSTYMVFSFALFSFIFIIGFTFPIFFRAEIFEFIKELIFLFEGKNVLEMISYIFFNNLKASFMALVLGIVFGIFPLFVIVVNGYLLGFVAREAVGVAGLPILWRLLPHGIFELPAVFFSIGIGLKIGIELINNKGKRKERLKRNYIEGLRFFLFVIIPLLIIAAVVEGILIWVSG